VAWERRHGLLRFFWSVVLVFLRTPRGAQRQGERVADVLCCGAGVVVTNSAWAKLGLCLNPVNKSFAGIYSQCLLHPSTGSSKAIARLLHGAYTAIAQLLHGSCTALARLLQGSAQTIPEPEKPGRQ